jgi:hypothetical protein
MTSGRRGPRYPAVKPTAKASYARSVPDAAATAAAVVPMKHRIPWPMNQPNRLPGSSSEPGPTPLARSRPCLRALVSRSWRASWIRSHAESEQTRAPSSPQSDPCRVVIAGCGERHTLLQVDRSVCRWPGSQLVPGPGRRSRRAAGQDRRPIHPPGRGASHLAGPHQTFRIRAPRHHRNATTRSRSLEAICYSTMSGRT